MSPVPPGDTPAYRLLRERVQAAIHRLQEEPGIEFKQSEPWEVLQIPITRAALGMVNLRDGGMIIVGVEEQGTSWAVTGIGSDHLSTYDPDQIRDAIDAFASPYIRCEVVTIQLEARIPSSLLSFLVLQVHEFEETPVVCKRNGPTGSKLQDGCVYFRPFVGRPATRRVTRAEDMHSLLELAAEKRAGRIVRVAQQLGLSIPVADSRLDEELGGL